MITNAIMMLLMCLFAFIPLLMGEFARNKSIATTEDFVLQGRNLKLFPMYATIFATWMSIFAFIGGIAYFYEQGPIFMTTVGWDALFAVLFIWIGRRLWFYSRRNGYMTSTDFFDDIYGSKVLNAIVIGITFICTMIYLQVQIVGGLLVINVATDGRISWYMGGVIFFAILVIYLWAGGLRAVAMTDIFYGILIVFAILSSGFYLMHIAGGTEHVFTKLIEMDPSNVSMTGPTGHKRMMMWISLFIIIPVGAFMAPQMWIRNYASSSAENFNALPFMLFVSSIICVGTLFAGSASHAMVGETDSPDSILIELIEGNANPYFYMFIIIGIYATIFSTANSQVHALSAVYTIDIYKRYVNSKAPERKLVNIAKWAVLVISMISYMCIIIVPQSIFDLGIIATGGLAQLIVPVLGALFWSRSTANAAVTGLICGEATFILGLLLNSQDESSICALMSLGVNTLIFIAVSLNDKARIKIYKKIDTYRREYRLKDY